MKNKILIIAASILVVFLIIDYSNILRKEITLSEAKIEANREFTSFCREQNIIRKDMYLANIEKVENPSMKGGWNFIYRYKPKPIHYFSVYVNSYGCADVISVSVLPYERIR